MAKNPRTRSNKTSLRQRRHRLKLAVHGFWGGWIYGPIRYRSWEFCDIWRDRLVADACLDVCVVAASWLGQALPPSAAAAPMKTYVMARVSSPASLMST